MSNKLNMKITTYISFFITLLLSGQLFSQLNPGTSCETAGCSTSGSYPSNTGVPSMGTFDCLFSTPNANWIAMGIETSGNLNFNISQGGDVDFAAYGPYSSVTDGCPIGPNTPAVDCSFSASASEDVSIPGVIAGEVYIILITNYSGNAGTITITDNGSSAVTNCNIDFSGLTSMTPATCGSSDGSVSVIPNGGFAPYTYQWDTPGYETTQTVNNVPAGTYNVTITSSPDPVSGATVNPTTASVTVLDQNTTYSAYGIPASCAGGTDGAAVANYVDNSGTLTATYLWNDPSGQTTQTATGLTPGPYSCTVTLSNGCIGTATANVGSSNVSSNSSSTLVSCPGGNDGTAIANMTPVVGNLSYLWNDAAAQTTQTATGLLAGNYSCTITSDIGCTVTEDVIVTEVAGMVSTITNQVDVTCNSGNNGIVEVSVVDGAMPYIYSWDNSSSTTNIANDLYVGDHTVTITDNNGCVITESITLGEPPALNISDLTPSTQICPEDDIQLNVTGTGGSSPHTFTWLENGVNIGTGTPITVDPDITNTNYCAILTEACGSPADTQCVLIYFPTPIIPSAIPDEIEKCVPNTFEFTNTSTNAGEIATTFWEFGDNPSHNILENGNDSTSHYYDQVGMQTITMTITSIYGCVYSDTLYDLIEVLPSPVAEFSFSNNPATIFETSILMQNASTADVVSWSWFSPGSTPSYSNSTSPSFKFPEGIPGQYPIQLIVETARGCIDTVEYIMHIIPDIIFYAPNSFTPDGDEFNQSWKPFIEGVDKAQFELLIFNRWGQLIWESHDTEASWDGTYNGKVLPVGTYSWVASVKSIYDDGKETFSGSINILK